MIRYAVRLGYWLGQVRAFTPFAVPAQPVVRQPGVRLAIDASWKRIKNKSRMGCLLLARRSIAADSAVRSGTREFPLQHAAEVCALRR
jgi:hypothetical protein